MVLIRERGDEFLFSDGLNLEVIRSFYDPEFEIKTRHFIPSCSYVDSFCKSVSTRGVSESRNQSLRGSRRSLGKPESSTFKMTIGCWRFPLLQTTHLDLKILMCHFPCVSWVRVPRIFVESEGHATAELGFIERVFGSDNTYKILSSTTRTNSDEERRRTGYPGYDFGALYHSSDPRWD